MRAHDDYVHRVNQAIDHVLTHLAEPIRLEDVAARARLSPFHFHRIFKALVGETLADFVTRVRLVRALRLMSQRPRPNLTGIALACGLGSGSNFSRVFKQRYGAAPSRFDVDALRRRRREALQATIEDEAARHLLDRLPRGENPDGFAVRLRELPARRVAYIRVERSYQPGRVEAACARLLAWADARGLADGQWLGYMWDDPDIVEHERCRYDVGLEIPDLRPSGEVGRIDFPPMRVAELEVRGGIDLEMRALDWLFSTWLPSSGHVPDEQPGFEAWIGRPFAHGTDYFEIRLQLPVVKG
ncbi:MAG: GyrI-like domain-containing protein [Nannocystaceae bacterium]